MAAAENITLAAASTDVALGVAVVEVHLATIQVAVLHKAAEQEHGAEGFIGGDSVACALHSGESVLREVLDVAGSGSVDEPGSPILLHGTLQLRQAKLSLGGRDCGHINVATVHHHLHIGTGREQGAVVGNHAGSASVV